MFGQMLLILLQIMCVFWAGKTSLDWITAAAEDCECDSETCICDFQANDRQTEGLLKRTYKFNRIGNGTDQL